MPVLEDEDRDLASRERSAPVNNSGSAADDQEKSALEEGGFYNSDTEKDGKSRIKGKLSRRKKLIGGGTVGVVVSLIALISSISTGPFGVIHYAQSLQRMNVFKNHESFGENRSEKFLLYALAGKSAKGRLGVIRNVQADRWEKKLAAKGLEPVYSKTPPQRMIGMAVNDNNLARDFIGDMKRQGISTNTPIDGVSIHGAGDDIHRVGVDLKDDNFKVRRAVTSSAMKTLKINKVSTYLGARLLKQRFGVNFHPLNKVKYKGDTFLQRRAEAREAQQNTISSGDPNKPLSPLGEKRVKILGKIKAIGSAAKGPVIAAAVTCGVKEFSGAIDSQNFENQQKAVRSSFTSIATGNQVMGLRDYNLEEVAAGYDIIYDEKTKTSVFEAEAIRSDNGQAPIGTDEPYDLPQDSKPGVKEKNIVFRFADEIPIGAVCTVFGAAAEAISKIPGYGLIESATDAALGKVGVDIKKLQEKALAYFTNGSVDEKAEGAAKGAVDAIGGRLGVNAMFIASGGVEQSPAQEEALYSQAQDIKQREIAGMSFFDRYFNAYESRSVVAQAYINGPKSGDQIASSLLSLPQTIASSFSKNFLFGRADAATTSSYDYGFPLYSFSLDEQNDPSYEDPYGNKDKLDAVLAATKAREDQCVKSLGGARPYSCEAGFSSWQELMTGDSSFTSGEGDNDDAEGSDFGGANSKQCFAVTMTPDGDTTPVGDIDFTKLPEGCDDNKSEAFTRYRFYLADITIGTNLACYEGHDESCGITDNGGSAPSSGSAVLSSDIRTLAAQILANKNITYPLDAVSDTGSTERVLEQIANGEKPAVACTNTDIVSADINPSILKFLAELGSQTKIGVNALTDKCHSPTSNHYKGLAVDFQCNGVNFDLAKADAVAEKYGGKRNFETCENHNHWHYDFK